MLTNDYNTIIFKERDDREKTMFIETIARKFIRAAIEMFYKNNNQILENPKVRRQLASAVAELNFTLEHEEFELVNMHNNLKIGELSKEYKAKVYRIREVKEEYLDLRRRMYVSFLLVDNVNTRRWIFRHLQNPVAANLTFSFMHTYNRWTEFTADYYITMARMEYDLQKFQQLIDESDTRSKLTMFQEAKDELAAEYDGKIADSRTQLSNYKLDLQGMAKKLCDEYSLLEKLQPLSKLESDKRIIYRKKKKKVIRFPMVNGAIRYDGGRMQQGMSTVIVATSSNLKKSTVSRNPLATTDVVGDTLSVTVNAQKCDVIISGKGSARRGRKKK